MGRGGSDRFAKAFMGVFFTLPFFAGGLAGVFWTQAAARHALDSPDWPVVEGQITESRPRPNRRRRGSYVIRYRYVVDGVAQQGHRVMYFSELFGPSREMVLPRYPVDSAVRVYHDPDDPSRAVLEPGISWWRAVGSGLGSMLFAALGGVGLVGSVRVGLRG